MVLQQNVVKNLGSYRRSDRPFSLLATEYTSEPALDTLLLCRHLLSQRSSTRIQRHGRSESVIQSSNIQVVTTRVRVQLMYVQLIWRRVGLELGWTMQQTM
jgi:hypothetical protein